MTYYDVMREDVDGPYGSQRDGHEEWCASCRGPEPCDCGWTAIVRVEAEVERLRGVMTRAVRKLDEGGVTGARELLAKELHG